MNYEFSGVEWSKMKQMVNAIWGVDLDAVKYTQVRSDCQKIMFPVWDDNCKAYWDAEEAARAMEDPKFEQELVELDRWLIPWKVKAGYSKRLNMLVYRVEA